MCGDRGMVIGGLIIAAAMMVWAYASNHAEGRTQSAPLAAAETSVIVSLDPMALEVRHGRLAIELSI
ncbi:hypothetical protein [Terricaulis sp.]|uniref:hypothetical protein n=1 Tax=Terricaulis sp. TaxID=2768686 RepID=UPI003785240B